MDDTLSGYQFRARKRVDAAGTEITSINARSGGRTRGYVEVHQDTPGPQGRPEHFVEALYVDPAHRGAGLGGQLMSEATKRFGGDRTMALKPEPFGDDPGPNAGRLRHFYAGHGFQSSGDGYMVRPPGN